MFLADQLGWADTRGGGFRAIWVIDYRVSGRLSGTFDPGHGPVTSAHFNRGCIDDARNVGG